MTGAFKPKKAVGLEAAPAVHAKGEAGYHEALAKTEHKLEALSRTRSLKSARLIVTASTQSGFSSVDSNSILKHA